MQIILGLRLSAVTSGAVLALQPRRPQLSKSTLSGVANSSTSHPALWNSSFARSTQLTLAAIMTVVETVKEAVGLGGGGRLTTTSNPEHEL